MSVTPNILKLTLNTEISQLLSELENIEWVSNQGQYTIEIEATSELDALYLLLTDKNGRLLEFSKTEKVLDNKSYTTISSIAPKLKGNSIIYLGAAYILKEINFRTEPIAIKINSSIAESEELEAPEEISPEYPGLLDLAEKFSDSKALMNVCVESSDNVEIFTDVEALKNSTTTKIKVLKLANLKTKEEGDSSTPYYLLVYYKDIPYAIYGGIISIDKETLGVVSKPDGENPGGGGQIGIGAESTLGFAGGFNSKTKTGAAVGHAAQSVSGFSGGENAKATANNIAIGKDSAANGEKDQDNIVIGEAAQTKENNYTVVIGRQNFVKESDAAIRIGGSANPEFEDGERIESGLIKSKRTISIGPEITSNNNESAVLIGSNIHTTKLSYEGQTKEHNHNGIWSNISIGTNSSAMERSCIAIGSNSVSGCIKDTDPQGTNQSAKPAYKIYDPENEPASVAIGRRSGAYGHASISIGKLSTASRFSSIALGYGAEAGPSFKENSDTLEKFYSSNNDGMKSIAVGYFAKAKADGAVQIGPGTNNEPFSLQFGYTKVENGKNVTYAVPIVKNGHVQVDLKEGTQGILPLDKGGTGASTKLGARRALGIFTGTFTRKLKPSEFESGTGKDIKLTYSSKYNFKSAPTAFVNLRMSTSDKTSPVLVDYYIKEVTTKYILIRVDYWPKDWDSKKNSDWNWYFDCLVIGNGEYKA